MTRVEEIRLIVDLTLARVEILKLKANDHDWAVYVPDETKKQLLDTLDNIDKMLAELA
jgi:hypothetical protein